MSGELDGMVSIITGASSGIGKGAARRLVEEGGRVAIADVDVEAGEEVVRELGVDVAFCRTDVSVAQDIERAVAFAIERFGDLDVMFNNAGISDPFLAGSLLDREHDIAQGEMKCRSPMTCPRKWSA